MRYEVAEQEIVDRLNGMFAADNLTGFYEAWLIPDTEHDFKEFQKQFTKARVAVQYIDSSFLPNKSHSLVMQEENARFRLTLEARKLRGEGGLYKLIELCKLYLLGFQITNADRLRMVKYGQLEFEQNHIQPYLEFECTVMNMQVHEDFNEAAFGGPLEKVNSTITIPE